VRECRRDREAPYVCHPISSPRDGSSLTWFEEADEADKGNIHFLVGRSDGAGVSLLAAAICLVSDVEGGMEVGVLCLTD
jgi:hypothetical protein